MSTSICWCQPVLEFNTMKNLDKAVFTVDETAKFLGIGRAGAYQAVAQGTIPSVRIGRRILVPKQALERLLEECNCKSSVEA